VKDSALVKNNISQKFQDSVRVGSDIAGDYWGMIYCWLGKM
jgi:hypothetical protein